MELDPLSGYSLDFDHLNEQVYRLLRNGIINGDLKPGQRLPVGVVAERLGISPTPVRDALRRLNTDGLVEMYPRRGTFVTEFNAQSVHEVFQIRRIVECAAIERLSDVAEEFSARLKEIVDEMNALRNGEVFSDYEAYIALDQEFHQNLVGLLGNQRLGEFYEKLRWPVQVVLGISLSGSQRAIATVAEHMSIVQALNERDIPKAQVAIREHLNNSEGDLMARMTPAG